MAYHYTCRAGACDWGDAHVKPTFLLWRVSLVIRAEFIQFPSDHRSDSCCHLAGFLNPLSVSLSGIRSRPAALT